MKRFGKIALVAAVLVTLASFSAMAYPVALPHSESLPGTAVAIPQEIKDFFAARGVDPQYLGMPKAQVPADVWAKIVAIVNPDERLRIEHIEKLMKPASTEPPSDYDILDQLVTTTLMDATTAADSPVYMDLGGQRWTYYQQTTVAPTAG